MSISTGISAVENPMMDVIVCQFIDDLFTETNPTTLYLADAAEKTKTCVASYTTFDFFTGFGTPLNRFLTAQIGK